MGSAYHLTEMYIWLKVNENPSRGKGDVDQHEI